MMLPNPWTYTFLLSTLLYSVNAFSSSHIPSIRSWNGTNSTTPSHEGIYIDSHIYNDYYDSYQMHYRLEGNAKNSSPVLVFSNGVNCDLRIWDEAVAVFKQRFPDYRFLRYDTRGYRFEGCDKPLNLTIVTHDIVVLLDALNIPKVHAVLGVSLGGTTALTFALQYPDRLNKFVTSDIFINASLAHPTTVDPRVVAAEKYGMPSQALSIVEGWFTSKATNDSEWNEAIRMVDDASPYGEGAINPVPNGFFETVNPRDLQRPGIYVVGNQDSRTLPYMRNFTATYTPNAGLHEIYGSHLCMWENPVGWVDAVESFLRD